MTREMSTASAEHIVPPPHESASLRRSGMALLSVGAALCVLALFRAEWRVALGYGYLWSFTMLWGIVLGALFFVAIYHLTHAVWPVTMRRVAEMLAAPMWVVALLFLPVVLFLLLNSHFHLFEWADPERIATDPLLQHKRPYLNTPFFILRAVFFFAAWLLFTRLYLRHSLAQDEGGGPEHTVQLRRISAPFMMVFGVTATFAGIDWMMSLEYHWFSTIFGVYVFSGMVLAALAAVTLAVVGLRAKGRIDASLVTRDHLYNLGALLFGFTCFWAYIAFSQYMLIWYGNIPEETFYFLDRLEGGWASVTVALFIVRFAVPFFLLLSRRAKMSAPALFSVSIVVLAGHALDLYWVIVPEFNETPVLEWQLAGPVLLMTGALLWFVARFLGRNWIVPVGDPLLGASRKFHL